ncbi:RNA methyltransferase [Heliorestis acidaminivorans]|uniref:RNA methyltransferase n=1 Tax=Heliorestis acidaminivorans TaxID=553427 RepID=A0A6I0FAB4_9FIRM|nr:RNA methyltransferase [Heliorestis acidaminivorans]KAB2954428.1 RNA methyltransferase [Heliorestis acidaminivorans]
MTWENDQQRKKALLYIALVHHPVYNKNMDIIATSVTNLDLHDISRTARTYDVAGYLILHPHLAQQRLVSEILRYWTDGYGAEYNPDRKEALERIEVLTSVEEAISYIEQKEGRRPQIITTDARIYDNSISYSGMRKKLQTEEGPWLLLFGTGFGMEKELMASADYILHPIWGRGDYNHLSVRSAAAIIIDRLLGESWFE